MQNEEYSVSPTIQFEDAKIVKYSVKDMETDITLARSEGYLAALNDIERDMEYLRHSYANQETAAINRGVSSEQSYWRGRLDGTGAVNKVVDNLRSGRVDIMQKHREQK